MSDHSAQQFAKYQQYSDMQNMQNATSADLKPQHTRLEQIGQRELETNKSLESHITQLYRLCEKLGITPPTDQEEKGAQTAAPSQLTGLLPAIFIQQTANMTQLRRIHSLTQELTNSL